MPFMTATSFALLGLEATKGTLSATMKSVPIETPQVTPQQKRLRDVALRGSPVDLYGLVAGVRNDQYDLKANVFADTFPILVRGTLGSTDTTVAAITSTTLASAATANSATISTTATCPAGSVILIDTGALQEAHVVASVTGAGPFTVTLTQPTKAAHNNGVTVSGLTAHKIGLQNDQVGAQPPGISIQDFDGAGAFQMLAGQVDEMSLTLGADTAFEVSAKLLTMPFTTIGTPSTSFSSEVFIPAWSGQTTIGSNTSVVVQEAHVNIKRGTQAIFTQGAQAPHSLFAGPCSVTGDMRFVVETGDTTLTTALATGTVPVIFALQDPTTGHLVHIQMSAVQLYDPKRERGKIYTEVTTNFEAEGNATDAVGGGQSPILVTVGNGQTIAY